MSDLILYLMLNVRYQYFYASAALLTFLFMLFLVILKKNKKISARVFIASIILFILTFLIVYPVSKQYVINIANQYLLSQ